MEATSIAVMCRNPLKQNKVSEILHDFAPILNREPISMLRPKGKLNVRRFRSIVASR